MKNHFFNCQGFCPVNKHFNSEEIPIAKNATDLTNRNITDLKKKFKEGVHD